MCKESHIVSKEFLVSKGSEQGKFLIWTIIVIEAGAPNGSAYYDFRVVHYCGPENEESVI